LTLENCVGFGEGLPRYSVRLGEYNRAEGIGKRRNGIVKIIWLGRKGRTKCWLAGAVGKGGVRYEIARKIEFGER